jgi:hypothetical protein
MISFRDMPKGASLHNHFSGYVKYSYILRHILYNTDFCLLLRNNTLFFRESFSSDSFLGKYKEITQDNVGIVYSLINKNIGNFQFLGNLFYNIIKYELFIPHYFNLIIRQMNEEKIDHIEFRIKFGTIYRRLVLGQGNQSKNIHIPIKQELNIYCAQFSKFQRYGKTFCMIPSNSKCIDSREKLKIYFDKFISYIATESGKSIPYNYFVKGFDIVGDEVSCNKLSIFKSVVDHIRKKTDLPFLPHAGEWIGRDGGEEKIKNNMNFVIKMDCCRIGHGIYAAVNETIMRKIKSKKIMLEICPLSNIYLKIVPYRTNIYRKLLDSGVIISVSADDTNKFNNMIMKDNFLYLYQEQGFTLNDIKKCCINSINYSLCSPERKAELLKSFNTKYKKWKNKLRPTSRTTTTK